MASSEIYGVPRCTRALDSFFERSFICSDTRNTSSTGVTASNCKNKTCVWPKRDTDASALSILICGLPPAGFYLSLCCKWTMHDTKKFRRLSNLDTPVTFKGKSEFEDRKSATNEVNTSTQVAKIIFVWWNLIACCFICTSLTILSIVIIEIKFRMNVWDKLMSNCLYRLFKCMKNNECYVVGTNKYLNIFVRLINIFIIIILTLQT